MKASWSYHVFFPSKFPPKYFPGLSFRPYFTVWMWREAFVLVGRGGGRTYKISHQHQLYEGCARALRRKTKRKKKEEEEEEKEEKKWKKKGEGKKNEKNTKKKKLRANYFKLFYRARRKSFAKGSDALPFIRGKGPSHYDFLMDFQRKCNRRVTEPV
jgi:hypothetical protein